MSANAAVPASFGRAARTYEVHATVQRAMAGWLGEWIPEDRAGRALELGAGTGLFTRKLEPWNGEMTASDIAEDMCEAGRRVSPGFSWRVMRAETPDGGPCDWLFACSMLQWLENPVAVFRAWRGMLKPGGRVLAGLFAEGSLPELRALTKGWTPLTWRTPEEWDEAVTGCGLVLRRSESGERVFHHGSSLELLRSLHGVGAAPYHQFTPGKLRRILRDYDTLHRYPEGVRSTWVFHRFEAERAD